MKTVSKAVRAPEVQDYAGKLREEVIALRDEMVKSVRFALRHEMDGQPAHATLYDIGVIQRPQAQVQLESQMLEEEWKEEWIKRLAVIALERHEVYGTQLPEGMEEIANATNSKEAAGIFARHCSSMKSTPRSPDSHDRKQHKGDFPPTAQPA